MGIPTVGGEVRFHPSYDGNCLVNAFTCGVVASDGIFLGTAAGVGNPMFYVGARTGRDGIHGATMASEEFGEGSEEKRPTVQVGDPFYEKLLLEACLELMESDCIVGIQDMGAAGLTSSSVEMAGRGGAGVHIQLDQVPMREEGMTPYEILLSESQERMLVVIRQGREQEVFDIFNKWDLAAAVIGHVTDDGVWRCSWHGEEVCAIPVPALTDAAPKYDRPQAEPSWQKAVQELVLPADVEDPEATLLRLIGHPDVCDRAWIFRQYDHQVGTDTVIKPGGDAGLVRIKGTNKHLAVATDCNGRQVYLDPHSGTAGQVVECARNLACVGATPLGLTDCLNFGNPEKPEIMWQFARSVDGMAEACEALSIPVVSGNVSLYNETDGQAILPTPGIAMVGLLEGESPSLSSQLQSGWGVALLGGACGHLGGSLYLWAEHDLERGMPPAVNYDTERSLHEVLRELVSSGLVTLAHDISDGGFAIALAETCVGGVGGDFLLPGDGRLDGRLFGEDHGRVLVAFTDENAAAVETLCKDRVAWTPIGRSGGDRLKVRTGADVVVDVLVEDLTQAWRRTLPEML